MDTDEPVRRARAVTFRVGDIVADCSGWAYVVLSIPMHPRRCAQCDHRQNQFVVIVCNVNGAVFEMPTSDLEVVRSPSDKQALATYAALERIGARAKQQRPQRPQRP